MHVHSDSYKWTHRNGVVEIVDKVPESIAPNDTLVRIKSSKSSRDIIQAAPTINKPYTQPKSAQLNAKNPNVNYFDFTGSKENRTTKSTLEILENATRIRQSTNQSIEQQKVASNRSVKNTEETYDPTKVKCEKYQRKYDHFNSLLRARHGTPDGNYYRRERNKYSELLYRECR